MSNPHRITSDATSATKGWHRSFFAVMAGLALPAMMWLSGCLSERICPPQGRVPVLMPLEVTGYCNCGLCCNWSRGWLGLGQAVIASGPNQGRPKAVGITASGTRAAHGTVAADTSVLPLGTIVYVPGYGYGRVEDRGGAIVGNHLDVWFPSHEEAVRWGRQRMYVRVWKP